MYSSALGARLHTYRPLPWHTNSCRGSLWQQSVLQYAKFGSQDLWVCTWRQGLEQ